MSITPPPHQDLTNPSWQNEEDAGGFFPTSDSAKKYAEGVATSDTHQDRLRALKHILSDVVEKSSLGTILDFGIGDGGQFLKLGLKARSVVGVDISPHMLELAAKNLSNFQFEGHCGSADVLNKVKAESVDLVLCLNVLGYLTRDDQNLFFKETRRVLKPGGFLLVMTGNELFDLFALNSGTAQFFQTHFSQDLASDLLLQGDSARFKNADRRNPLKFCEELKQYGLRELSQSFSQWHKTIPALANIHFKGDLRAARLASRDHNLDPNKLSDLDKWKALFCCTIFASLSVKGTKTNLEGYSREGF